MSTTSTSSTAESSSQVMEQRPQAGPLPKKRGEIGYREGMNGVEVEPVAVPAPAVLPERHPADRDATPAPASPSPAARNSTSSTTNTSVPPPGDAAASTTPSGAAATADDASSMTSLGKSKKIPKYFGIRLTTILLLLFQAFILAGTITIWGISIQILTHGSITGHKTNNDNDNTNDSNSPPGASSAIFVHVVFGIVLLVQLLFLERRIYRVRAERYAHLHPGEVLPTSSARARMLNDPYIAISPWNRPPLPTYAAALAQSGVGTGDVEDHLIAAPPPPAYGNTRGSTLILAGFLRNSLRAQRPPSVHSVASTRTNGERTSRPVSYATVDEEWEVIQNADRARALEETLDRLEQSPSSRG